MTAQIDKFLVNVPNLGGSQQQNLEAAFNEALQRALQGRDQQINTAFAQLQRQVMELEQGLQRVAQMAQTPKVTPLDVATRVMTHCSRQNEETSEAETDAESRCYDKSMLLMEACLDTALRTQAASLGDAGGAGVPAPAEAPGAGGADQGDRRPDVGDQEEPGPAEDR